MKPKLEATTLLIIGTGQYESVRLSEKAQAYLRKHNCRTKLAAKPDAIHIWNKAKGKVIGLFHVTC